MLPDPGMTVDATKPEVHVDPTPRMEGTGPLNSSPVLKKGISPKVKIRVPPYSLVMMDQLATSKEPVLMEPMVLLYEIRTQQSVVSLKDPVVMEVMVSPKHTEGVDWDVSPEESSDLNPHVVNLKVTWSGFENEDAG